jgi:GntR family transcriptional regulator
MLFRVDVRSAVPLGDQIAGCVRGAIADGTAVPGERLPAAREVAGSLGINVHTVLRGYQRLRAEGLIELRRGRGAVISAGASAPDRARLIRAAHRLAVDARSLGLSDQEVLDLLRGELDRTRPVC